MFYSLKEGFSGLLRTKVSTTIATSVICLSLIVIGVFLIFISNTKRLVDSIQERIALEVFIDNSFDAEKIEKLRQQLSEIEGIKKIVYVSKEEAAEFFKQQFGQDIFEISEENPLPASFQVMLMESFLSSANARKIVDLIQEMDGVDEVLFRQELMYLLEKYLNFFFIISLSIGGLLVLGSIMLVSNTIKLVILSRIKIIETMKLVGATRGFIRRPLIVEGILQGLIGSILAVAFFYASMKIVDLEIPKLIAIDREIFGIIFVLGIALGILGSLLAIQRFLKY